MITVHHLENSRSQRVLWLLEELGVPYQVKRYERNRKTMLAPPELLAVHPLGKSPVITDGEHTVAESGAITEYLVETYGKGQLSPERGTAEFLRYRYWLHYAEGSIMPLMVMTLIFNRMPVSAPLLVRPLVKGIANGVQKQFLGPQLALHLGYIERELEKNEWFVGDQFSAADIIMSFPLEAAMSRGGIGDSHPRISAFVERIHARPGYQEALKKGGPYALLR
jgi:glutathione S-transferase